MVRIAELTDKAWESRGVREMLYTFGVGQNSQSKNWLPCRKTWASWMTWGRVNNQEILNLEWTNPLNWLKVSIPHRKICFLSIHPSIYPCRVFEFKILSKFTSFHSDSNYHSTAFKLQDSEIQKAFSIQFWITPNPGTRNVCYISRALLIYLFIFILKFCSLNLPTKVILNGKGQRERLDLHLKEVALF